MDKTVNEVLRGGVGYFWVLEKPSIGELTDEDAIPGFVGRVGESLEIDLLHEDPLALLNARDDPFPEGLVGITADAGMMVLNVRGRTRKVNIAASRAPVERYRAETLVVHPGAVHIDTTRVRSVSAFFRGNAMLTWGDFDAFERQTDLDTQHRVQSATIRLKPTSDRVVALSRAVDLRLSGHWGFRDDEELRHVIETALEVDVVSRRPMPFEELIRPLLRSQEFLSIAFSGFVAADGGRVGCSGVDERGHLWNATLMPEAPASHVPLASRNARPLFHLGDVGGVDAFARWIRLCRGHPRAVSPIVNLFRRGASSDDVRLLELASAIEYWVAAHRRSSGWAKQGKNYAEAVALHIGKPFAAWSGDSRRWSQVFWRNYTKLKHDPSFLPDPFEVKALQESAYLVLLAEIMNRVSGSKRPAAHIFGDPRHRHLKKWTRDAIGT